MGIQPTEEAVPNKPLPGPSQSQAGSGESREAAYRKAIKFGAIGMPSKTNGGEWRFAGISMLLPVYDKIEDGSEILWKGGKMMSVASIRKLVRTQRHLPVFNDTEKAA